MYGNNMNNPFIMSNMYSPMNNMIGGSMIRSAPIMGNPMINSPRMIGGATRSGGLLSSLFGGRGTGGMFQGLRTFNFGSLLNNASKALGVVNQAIPIVKEVGPMMGNMKQILKIASVFKDETDINTNIRSNNSISNALSETETNTTTTKEKDTNIISTTKKQNDSEPNFFL